ncbi:helix-turn-helix domain-containing protein [Chryseobacterium contaminans]|nr:helix-turn-helix transcriptional regulator [Chryseobacterium contaminans]
MMEKLKSLRKQRGYTQEYMSKIISTDVSNYSRKESGDVRIYDDEWEQIRFFFKENFVLRKRQIILF